jgi:hypothetical protein
MSGKRILLEPMARGVKGTKYSRTYVNSPGKIAGNVLDDVLRGRKSAGLNVKTIRKSAPAYGSGTARGKRLVEADNGVVAKRMSKVPASGMAALQTAGAAKPVAPMPAVNKPLTMKKPGAAPAVGGAVAKAARTFDPETARHRRQGERTGALVAAGTGLAGAAIGDKGRATKDLIGATRHRELSRLSLTRVRSLRKLGAGAGVLALANASHKDSTSEKNRAWR